MKTVLMFVRRRAVIVSILAAVAVALGGVVALAAPAIPDTAVPPAGHNSGACADCHTVISSDPSILPVTPGDGSHESTGAIGLYDHDDADDEASEGIEVDVEDANEDGDQGEQVDHQSGDQGEADTNAVGDQQGEDRAAGAGHVAAHSVPGHDRVDGGSQDSGDRGSDD